MPTWQGSVFKECKLRCHYVHVTGPEATTLMNKEHVRLMKLWNGNHISKQFTLACSTTGSAATMDIDLAFLHPVQELIITIRKVNEMGSATDNAIIPHGDGINKAVPNTAATKNYFAYQGGGRDPNYENLHYCVEENNITNGSALDLPTHFKTTTFTLKLNGQSRHLDGQGIDRDYLMNRLMPMMHSNTREECTQIRDSSKTAAPYTAGNGTGWTTAMSVKDDLLALQELKDRKEIYVYPFALNPEGANPSGSVNFSKVSHAKLSIGIDCFAPGGTCTEDVQVDVYGVYYNWLAIKDGRALTSFA